MRSVLCLTLEQVIGSLTNQHLPYALPCPESSALQHPGHSLMLPDTQKGLPCPPRTEETETPQD